MLQCNANNAALQYLPSLRRVLHCNVIGIALSLLVVLPARAEPRSATPAVHAASVNEADPVAGRLLARRRSARIERGFGIGLVAAGLATALAGALTLWVAQSAPYDQGTQMVTPGAVTLSVGAGVVVPGIVLAFHGQWRLDDADWRLEALRTAFVAPSRDGVLAGARFRF